MCQAPVIHWFRRDLRLDDNHALHAACAHDAPVIGLFIFDPTILSSERVGAPRLRFLLDALAALDARLQTYGTRLLILHGDPQIVVPSVVAETKAQALYFNTDYSPYARQRDDAIAASLSIDVQRFDDVLLLPPGQILKSDGTPYVVYTPFWKKWKAQQKPALSRWQLTAAQFADVRAYRQDGIPSLNALGCSETLPVVEASEGHAKQLLAQFIAQDICYYRKHRNTLVINPWAEDRPLGTSYLSPFLRLGLLSPRQLYWAAREAYAQTDSENGRKSIEKWISELAWREFYNHILYFFPHVLTRDFVDTYRHLNWENDPDDLQAWQLGRTGYPIVDAAMRQMQAIGWMPNRARMVVASFLTKDLLIHWRAGDLFFMKHLIDGDPAANNGGWQWAAGTGTDAQPYFRIFNPVSQSEKFASPRYLRHWLPELADVPDDLIHAPWLADQPPSDYPAPIIDHKIARERTLAAFKAARGG